MPRSGCSGLHGVSPNFSKKRHENYKSHKNKRNISMFFVLHFGKISKK